MFLSQQIHFTRPEMYYIVKQTHKCHLRAPTVKKKTTDSHISITHINDIHHNIHLTKCLHVRNKRVMYVAVTCVFPSAGKNRIIIHKCQETMLRKIFYKLIAQNIYPYIRRSCINAGS